MSIRKKLLAQCLREALLGSLALGLAMPAMGATLDAAAPAANPDAQAAAAGSAAQDDAAPTLDAVVVTSQSREQSLQDVPIAVQVIDDAMIDEVAAYDLGDLADFVPGLEISDDSPTQ